MTYISKNLKKSKRSGGGTREAMDTHVIFIPQSVTKNFPKSDANGVKMIENFLFNDGEYVEKIYATAESIKLIKNGDGDQDAVGFLSGIEFSHPGDEIEVNEFIQNRVNVPGYIAVGIDLCTENPYYKIIGNCAAPLTLKMEGQNDNEATKNIMKFDSVVKSGSVPKFYFGTFTFETPVATIAADATTVDVVTGNGEYLTTTGSASAVTIGAFSNVTEGTVITLKGSGGAYPTVVDAASDILLQDGASWTANNGATLTLKAFKSGASAFTMLEVGRS
jgi:hypothetical protein